MKPEEITYNLNKVNKKLEVTLYFLKECLEMGTISTNTDQLVLEGLNIEFLDGQGIDDLMDVRDHLLNQCQIRN